ncbi:hypothetical protein NFI95_15695 [Acetobacteraceae bacterium KSS8]|uniref:Uncharacterized protein n=1 Tax=Endosaccharibacter trunci TaxID=2812733 RepID=A0ABT1WDK1_9PROT|nr:hypothetical protein [Acetobacteraceae bacterium KSS8]
MPSAIQTLAWRGFGFDGSSKKGERFCELRLGPFGLAFMQQSVMEMFAAERAKNDALAIENERLRDALETARRGDVDARLRAARMAEDVQ